MYQGTRWVILKQKKTESKISCLGTFKGTFTRDFRFAGTFKSKVHNVLIQTSLVQFQNSFVGLEIRQRRTDSTHVRRFDYEEKPRV